MSKLKISPYGNINSKTLMILKILKRPSLQRKEEISLSPAAVLQVRQGAYILCHSKFASKTKFNITKRTNINSNTATYSLDYDYNIVIKQEPLRNEIVVKPLQCDQCLKVFFSKSCLSKHIKYHFNDLVRRFKCPHCKKGFIYSSCLRKHLQVHEDSPLLTCEVCFITFKRQKNLDLHKKRHRKEYVVKCEDCKIGFVCKSDFNRHMKDKHKVNEQLCAFCVRQELFDRSI